MESLVEDLELARLAGDLEFRVEDVELARLVGDLESLVEDVETRVEDLEAASLVDDEETRLDDFIDFAAEFASSAVERRISISSFQRKMPVCFNKNHLIIF